MWTQGQQSKRARADEDEDDEVGTNIGKLVAQIEFRLRKMEGATSTWFLPHTDEVLLQYVESSAKDWESKKERGKPHVLGPNTIGGAILCRVALADLSQAVGKQLEHLKETDEMLRMLKQPSVAEQQEFLRKLLQSHQTPQAFEKFVLTAECFRAKKSNRAVVQLMINPTTPMTHITPYFNWAMESVGAERADGNPPRGQLVRRTLGGK